MNWSDLTVLVTGGTGSFGRKFTEIVLRHYRPKKLIVFSRDETAQYWKLDPNRAWYLYTSNTEAHTPTEPRLVAEIASAFEEARLLQQGCLVIRPHPLDSYERWSCFQNGEPWVSVRYPWSEGEHGLAQSDLSHHTAWVNLVRHSAVCLNVGSSTTLDAAAVDCPIVLVNFAAQGQAGEDHYYKQFNFWREHYGSIARHPGLRVAHNLADVVQHVQAYAADPGLDRAARRQLAQEFCGRLDGQSARRVAEAISSVMNHELR